MKDAEKYLNEYRQKLIENNLPIDCDNPQQCFPGWWEDKTVAEMMESYHKDRVNRVTDEDIEKWAKDHSIIGDIYGNLSFDTDKKMYMVMALKWFKSKLMEE